MHRITCSASGCSESIYICPEVVGDTGLTAFCQRAQGWGKAKRSSHVYCWTHRTQIEPCGPEYSHPVCWERHNSTSTSGSSSTAVPVHPVQPLQQCNDSLCQVGWYVCEVCRSRTLPWDCVFLVPLAEQVRRLTQTLNDLPSHVFPKEFFVDFSDASLKGLAAGYDRQEPDCGNKAGSAVLLAMLLPEVYGIPGNAPLRIFGSPPFPALLHISNVLPRSGRGPDNLRNNVWEALLAHWAGIDHLCNERDMLLLTLIDARLALDQFVDPQNDKLVWTLPRPMLQYDLQRALGHRARGSHGRMV